MPWKTISLMLGLAGLLSMLLLVEPAYAQKRPPVKGLPRPQLTVVMPAGGKIGASFEVVLSGQELGEPEGLLFSHPGIKAEAVKVPDAAAKKTDPKKPPAKNPAPAAPRFRVTISPGTPLGNHDVRLITRSGISNPRAFVVGDLDEIVEKEPNNDVGLAQRVGMNTTINGTIQNGTDVDYFVFKGTHGQRVIISCLTSSIDSRLIAGLELYDATGKQLGSNIKYLDSDALLDAVLPEDGDYFVRLFSFTYTQGSPEHFYRLSISTSPWIDAVFPPIVEPGKSTRLTVYGRNLPGGKAQPRSVVDGHVLEELTVTVEAPEDPMARQRLAYRGHIGPKGSALDGFEFRLHNASRTSNPFLLTYARAPVVADNQDNDRPETAQEITLPCEIAGRIEKKRDLDWYTFTAHKGEVYSIETFGDRLGSPFDPYFLLRNAETKKTVIESADNPDPINSRQFYWRNQDPARFRFVVPADGRFQLLVGSREASVQAGPREYYRVRITPEEPDFRLIVMPQNSMAPDACVVRRGSCQYFTVFIWRLDGWNGDITLNAVGLPQGVTCPPQHVGPTVRQATLVVAADADAEPWAGPIEVNGTALIQGRSVVREARPATITWPVPQINFATVSRLDQSLVLAVREAGPYGIKPAIQEVKVIQGGDAGIDVEVERHNADFKGPVYLTIPNLPPFMRFNRNNQPVLVAADKKQGKINVNLNQNALPGSYTLVVRGQGVFGPMRGDPRNNPNIGVIESSVPIALTVLPKPVAAVAVMPKTLNLKAGDEADIQVKVTRTPEFNGAIRVQLIAAKKDSLQAQDLIIPSGKDEGRLLVQAAEEARAGNRSNLIVRATGLGKGKVTVETRLSVQISK
jgi:hypothetical protein